MKHKDILVSVSVVTYNHKDYISECLDSILMQKTNFPFEIIIGEDESSDGTREICVEYANQYPDKIRLFLRSRKEVIYIEGSPTGRFNMIENLKAARGKYIALCEGDDYWLDPYKLQKQFNFLEQHKNCVLCHHWHRYAHLEEGGIYTEREAPILDQGYLPQEIATIREVFANKLRVKTRTNFFRNVIKEYPDWIWKVAYGDVPLSMILGKYGKFGFIDEPMAVYRQTGVGASSVGKESHSYYYNHFLNWIKVWEYGINYYQYQYYEEAKGTLLYFYSFILKSYGFGINTFSKLLIHAIFQSKIKIIKRIGISLSLCMMFMINFLPRFLKRVKTKAFRLTFRHV